VATGLLISEVSINTMATRGAAGVSLVTMVRMTLGQGQSGGAAERAATLVYMFMHFTLLVACEWGKGWEWEWEWERERW
jgi:hypothetical protein